MSKVTSKVTWSEADQLFVGTGGSGGKTVMDIPSPDREMRGPGPKELTLISLGGCSGVNLVSMLKKMRQEVTRVEMDFSADVATTNPAVFTHIDVTYQVYGKGVDPTRVQKALDHIEEKYCGVLHMLNKTATVAFTFEVIEES